VKTLKDWEKYKILATLRKYKGKHKILFLEDPEDPWFVICAQISLKNNKLEYFTFLIKKDLNIWIEYKKTEKYTLQ